MSPDEAIRTFVRLIEDTAARPFGLLSLVAFLGTTLAYLILRGVDPRWSGRLMWLVFASLIAVGYTVSETQQRAPIRSAPGAPAWTASAPSPGPVSPTGQTGAGGALAPRPPSGTPPAASSAAPRPPAPPATGPGATSGAAAPGAASTGPPTGQVQAPGTAAPAPSAPGAPGAMGPPAERPQDEEGLDPSSPDQVTRPPGAGRLVFGRLASRDVTTADHRCPNPARGISDCEGQPTRTTYRVTITAEPSERLLEPELRCLDGPCDASVVHYARVSADGRLVEATFDVWSTPTRWRLTAVRDAAAPDRR